MFYFTSYTFSRDMMALFMLACTLWTLELAIYAIRAFVAFWNKGIDL